MRKYSNSIPLSFCLFFMLILVSCKKEAPTIVRINLEEFSATDMQKIGNFFFDAAEQSGDNLEILNAATYSEAYDYLNQMVEMLAYTEQIEHSRTFNWSVSILDNDNISSAFVLPGGHLYVYTGMLKAIEDESELAALLAHEMMYTDQGMVIAEIKENFGGAILGDILLGNEVSASKAVSIVNWVSEISFSEQQVRDADAFSVNTICPFLYDATGMIRLLRRIKEDNIEEVEWLVTRPGALPERIDALLAASELVCEDLNGSRYEERFEKIKALLP